MSETPTIRLTRSAPDGVPAASIEVPSRVGSVRLIRQIGRGAMGVVWLGNDELLGREVAVKFLIDAVSTPEDPGFRAFVEGARAAATIRHPGLTQILHAGLVEGVPYVVMEYVDGPVLSEVIRRTGPLGVCPTLGILDAVCAATAELHDRGVVHRDLKPSNILLDTAGRIVVTDFGLACPRPTGAIGGASGRTGGVAGTPHYMAPEMFEGAVSVRADVYAIGIMAVELLTGAVPWTGSLEQIRIGHTFGRLPVQAMAQRDVAPALIDVIERATHKEPLYRHKTAAHLIRAIKEACPEPAVWTRAASEAASLAVRADGEPGAPELATPADTASYYESLQGMATKKRSAPKPVPPPAPAPPPGMIRAHVPCAVCEYDLRGLTPAGPCPECGAAIEFSLHPDRLMFADRRWLTDVKRGLECMGWVRGRWWLVYIAWLVIVSVISASSVSAPPGSTGNPVSPGAPTAPRLGMRTSHLATALSVLPIMPFMVYGGWLLTRPEPTRRRPDHHDSEPPRRSAQAAAIPGAIARLGRVTRVSARILLRLAILALAAWMIAYFVAPLAGVQTGARLLVSLILIVLLANGLFCLHIGMAVERIPRRRLARCAYAAAADAIVVFTLLIAAALAGTSVMALLSSVWGIALVVAGAAALVFAYLTGAAGARAIGRVLATAAPLDEAIAPIEQRSEDVQPPPG